MVMSVCQVTPSVTQSSNKMLCCWRGGPYKLYQDSKAHTESTSDILITMYHFYHSEATVDVNLDLFFLFHKVLVTICIGIRKGKKYTDSFY